MCICLYDFKRVPEINCELQRSSSMKKTAMSLLAMDFDGVLFDTGYEKLFTGFNSYLALNPNSRLLDGESLTFDTVEGKLSGHENIQVQFNNLLDFIGIAGENAAVFELVERGISVTSYDEYMHHIKRIERSRYEAYHEMVLNKRQLYSENYSGEYMGLIKPFEGVIDAIKHTSSRIRSIICTMKPRENVEMILKVHGFHDLFDDIICVTGGQSKIYALEDYADRNGLSPTSIYFFDDHPHHLRDRQSTRVQCYLAKWGYHVPGNDFGDQIPDNQTMSISEFINFTNSLINCN